MEYYASIQSAFRKHGADADDLTKTQRELHHRLYRINSGGHARYRRDYTKDIAYIYLTAIGINMALYTKIADELVSKGYFPVHNPTVEARLRREQNERK